MDQVARLIRQRRISKGLSMRALAAACSISPSHLGRIENGERLPSAHVLRKFAKPLGFDEGELFMLAGFLSPPDSGETMIKPDDTFPGLDPYVARVLAQEPIHVQRKVIDILTMMKSLADNKKK